MTPKQLGAWRARLGWSQREAARQLGVTLPTYQRLERGEDWTSGEAVSVDRRTALACAALEMGVSRLPAG